MRQIGYGLLWTVFSSFIIYAGSLQFLLVSLLRDNANLIYVILMTISLNSRHIFYGLSYLDKFKKMGKSYPYMVFSLTDETYSLLSSVKVPDDLDENRVFFMIALLNHSYWIFGGAVGAILGEFLPSDIVGIDFSMTALFVVLFIEQFKNIKNRKAIYIGISSAVICLIVLGANRFILPALSIITFILILFKDKISANQNQI